MTCVYMGCISPQTWVAPLCLSGARYVVGAVKAKCWACFEGLENLSAPALKAVSFVVQEMRRTQQEGASFMKVGGLKVYVTPATRIFACLTINGTYMTHHETLQAERLGTSFRTLLLVLPHAEELATVRFLSLGFPVTASRNCAAQLVQFLREVCTWRMLVRVPGGHTSMRAAVGGMNTNDDVHATPRSVTKRTPVHRVRTPTSSRRHATSTRSSVLLDELTGVSGRDDDVQDSHPLMPWGEVRLLHLVLDVMQSARWSSDDEAGSSAAGAAVGAAPSHTLSRLVSTPALPTSMSTRGLRAHAAMQHAVQEGEAAGESARTCKVRAAPVRVLCCVVLCCGGVWCVVWCDRVCDMGSSWLSGCWLTGWCLPCTSPRAWPKTSTSWPPPPSLACCAGVCSPTPPPWIASMRCFATGSPQRRSWWTQWCLWAWAMREPRVPPIPIQTQPVRVRVRVRVLPQALCRRTPPTPERPRPAQATVARVPSLAWRLMWRPPLATTTSTRRRCPP